MASKKNTCDRVRRGVAGKTRDEIMDVICVEFDLPRPKTRLEQPDAATRPKPTKTSRKAKS
ncbi:MAG TPA: hypothetical protein VG742_14320 [Dongiaceae bacterium]|nr:hypothetical protein [Dongiaceae bacterium]